MRTEKIINMEEFNYRNEPGINISFLKHFLSCPAKAIESLKKQTPAMSFGTKFHEYILEPKKFIEKYYIIPEQISKLDKRTKLFKDAMKELEAKNEGMIPLHSDEHVKLVYMEHALHERAIRNISLKHLVEMGECELAIFWQEYSLQAKAKLDIAYDNFVGDIKTISNIDKAFYDIKNYRYDMQAAWYLKGYSKITGIDTDDLEYYLLFCETDAPHRVVIYKLESMEKAFQDIEFCKQKYNEWLIAGKPYQRYYEQEIKVY
jgi:exodeoxyribonuclease VIII